MPTYLAGFTLGITLILAIGAQNTFVLKQGIKQQHVFLVCAICAFSDAILISFGVLGFGYLVKQFPLIETIARYAGMLFLIWYGLSSLHSSLTQRHVINPEGNTSKGVWKTALFCLAFTWLNPHVYLDTVVLLGSISTQYDPHQWYFYAGALTASFVFFFSLGYGAKYLTPIFRHARSWQILEFIIGWVMLFLAISLVV
ncbi:LysE/ArgO family amino acid transporter [Vibrio alfacsensis]|uniref:LysE/ArgO family amino acid transporter n=1 Tax=Vibrio alfacsensis TaxID=1074311 RepID=UPI001BEF072A|nr:LysE/ArgO family amino acid transporter [Vibrio alfacsensis]BBM66143.1 amino acid transporter [Vibrio alfacsensis]BCN25587.1 amino acid transporter [Vibrio alfacsensis]